MILEENSGVPSRFLSGVSRGELLKLHLAINVSGLVEPTEPDSKKNLWHRCFPVNFSKFLRTPFFTEHLRWLLLK